MHSIRTKITVLTVCVTIMAVAVVAMFSVVFIVNTEQRKSDQLLLLLCETGSRNLDYYFNSVEKSIKKVSAFAEEDLENTEPGSLDKHVERVRDFFDITAHKTNGVLTYYYRIDPDFSKSEKGFWYTNLEGDEFTEHEVTDITKYDTTDTSQLVWFTIPKAKGEPVWLPPYITDNLDERVISYNIPIYQKGHFAGVIGIEIDYSTLAEQVEVIRFYSNGYAFINDREGNLIFHPYIDVTTLDAESMPETPDGVLSEKTFYHYEFDGVEKRAAWLPLSNGMRLNVCAPVSEVNGDWINLIKRILIGSLLVLAVLICAALAFSNRITRPLKKLAAAAEQIDSGNYDFELDYKGDDEVGRLTNAFKQLTGHMKEHINDLSLQSYMDSLTSVRNKEAFTAYIEWLQKTKEKTGEKTAFAVAVFDCDGVKLINDRYGHDKGDAYLKTASHMICRLFQHSPVFRTGGDEFTAILQKADFVNREELIHKFEKECENVSKRSENEWEQIHITMGLAEYDPDSGETVLETVRRADRIMYEKKRQKSGRA